MLSLLLKLEEQFDILGYSSNIYLELEPQDAWLGLA